jgi:hypothetical protein
MARASSSYASDAIVCIEALTGAPHPDAALEDLLFSFTDNPYDRMRWGPDKSVAGAAFKVLFERGLSDARSPSLSRASFPDLPETGRGASNMIHLRRFLLDAPLGAFQAGRDLLERFLHLTDHAPPCGECPPIHRAMLTALTADALLGCVRSDGISCLEAWAGEKAAGDQSRAKRDVQGSIRTSVWAACFLFELGALAEPLFKDGAAVDQSYRKILVDTFRLTRNPEENRALLDRGVKRLKARGHTTDETSSGRELSTFSAVHASEVWIPSGLDGRDRDAELLGSEVLEALLLLASSAPIPVTPGKWLAGLLAACRPLIFWAGYQPCEPHPPALEIRRASYARNSEILLRDTTLTLTADFRIIPPEFGSETVHLRRRIFNELESAARRLDITTSSFPLRQVNLLVDASHSRQFKIVPHDTGPEPAREAARDETRELIDSVEEACERIRRENWEPVHSFLGAPPDRLAAQDFRRLYDFVASRKDSSPKITALALLLPYLDDASYAEASAAVRKRLAKDFSEKDGLLICALSKSFLHMDEKARDAFCMKVVRLLRAGKPLDLMTPSIKAARVFFDLLPPWDQENLAGTVRALDLPDDLEAREAAAWLEERHRRFATGR